MIGRTGVKTPVLPCSITASHTDAGSRRQSIKKGKRVFYGKSKGADKKKYIGVFTFYNVLMLLIMIVVRLILYVVFS